MTWQFNWRRWQWPWRRSKPDGISDIAGRDYEFTANWAGVGPLQFHWYSSKKT